MHWGKRIGLGMAAASVIGGAVVGGVALQSSAAVAGDRDAAAQARAADKQAKLAERALKARKHDEAIGRAEQAVLLAPDSAAHRALLGRTYLGAGRFASAAQAFEDALALNGADGRAALNLALAKVALGDWAGARKLLDAHGADIQPADRGLAIALAGDPMAAVAVLGEAARDPAATAKVRQNLALSLALAGKWQEARTIAGIDLAPAEADKRIMQWAQFARPNKASDQVASLLGVSAVEDGGMPVQLALRGRGEAVAMAAAPTPLEAFAPSLPAEVSPPAAEPAAIGTEMPRAAGIVFAERREIVQAIPDSRLRPVRTATAMSAAPARVRAAAADLTPGSYFVQLGAFENASVARDAWGRISRRVPALGGQTPRGMAATVGSASYYRLSVGGYSRGDAVALCGSVRAKGGRCFVRPALGEQVASWARGTQLASR
ncbi:sporulation protein [Sphingomonas spermidinifaciens]|uniref:Sporulation protein n=1 Tax=Sphingomonas spermidinifaciens TaxID=1141889 RepID=A0A2A4B501_9SPHN|nr:SPOR domain-containing protein [Sphingomonas spermidinifaciens]PCD03137.1 sporulation protein [Sphingomonas spermidinifaciens]